AQLLDQVLLEHDRGRQGFVDRSESSGCADVLSEIPPLELLGLKVALTGLLLNRLRASPSPRHRASFRCAVAASAVRRARASRYDPRRTSVGKPMQHRPR